MVGWDMMTLMSGACEGTDFYLVVAKHNSGFVFILKCIVTTMDVSSIRTS